MSKIYLTQTRTTLNADEDNNVHYSPSDRRNIAYFEGSGEFTLVLNTTNCSFGDEIVLLLVKGDDPLNMNLPEDKFYLTYCGSLASNLILNGVEGNTEGENVVGTDTFMLNFYFNGEKFISTFDKG